MAPWQRQSNPAFDQRCQEAGVNGNLAIVHGDVSDQIIDYALLTDLVVLNVSHAPEPGLSGLGSGLRSHHLALCPPDPDCAGQDKPAGQCHAGFRRQPKIEGSPVCGCLRGGTLENPYLS